MKQNTVFENGMVAVSKAGRDAGKLMMIVRADKFFAYVADGKERKIENPKKKNYKHLARTGYRISTEFPLSNKGLKKTLGELRKPQIKISPEEGVI